MNPYNTTSCQVALNDALYESLELTDIQYKPSCVEGIRSLEFKWEQMINVASLLYYYPPSETGCNIKSFSNQTILTFNDQPIECLTEL